MPGVVRVRVGTRPGVQSAVVVVAGCVCAACSVGWGSDAFAGPAFAARISVATVTTAAAKPLV